MKQILIIRPWGTTLAWPVEGDDTLSALQRACGGSIAYFPEAYHELDRYEVVHLDDWPASRLIGLPGSVRPLRGTVVLVPLPEGQDNRAEREHQRHYFGMLDAVACGFCTADEAGIGELIRVDEDAA